VTDLGRSPEVKKAFVAISRSSREVVCGRT
jgi:hypothetical protein